MAQGCSCPKGDYYADTEKPKIIFSLGNGQKIGVCGSAEYEHGDTLYSDFSIYLCGSSDKIDEWGATESCKLERIRNGLQVKELYALPIGTNFSAKWTPFYIYMYVFENSILKKTTYFNNTLRKYKAGEIKTEYKQYDTLVKENS